MDQEIFQRDLLTAYYLRKMLSLRIPKISDFNLLFMILYLGNETCTQRYGLHLRILCPIK